MIDIGQMTDISDKIKKIGDDLDTIKRLLLHIYKNTKPDSEVNTELCHACFHELVMCYGHNLCFQCDRSNIVNRWSADYEEKENYCKIHNCRLRLQTD